ncbi:AAA family ATPase [Microbulbifer sp. OS29]|uniref:AAA family ATPase n=1 Tax=Microbulbifer okhotskensis TaxID=2926617 RepID=A0A9X2EPA1_9GAMM|nr:AAA family ATPase [Microbulbifer okhotskensis]MCO1335336.1 AAA family ATPase [Microbulbifer okhotskensis]
MLQLKTLLKDRGMTQSALARKIKMSPATVAQICNHAIWPKKREKELKRQILKAVGNCGEEVFKQEGSTQGTKEVAPVTQKENHLEDDIMLLRKQALTPQARRTFNLVRDPFDECRNSDEVFLTPDARYVRESLRQVARHGGFVALVGESGSGKSTLRRDLIGWVDRESEPTIIIEPYVLGMEDCEAKGKTLKSGHIAESILAAVAPGQHVPRSSEARFRQVHKALLESHRAGSRHLLIIEEAHGIPLATLKHLKRFFELEDGFSKLLGIVLIGQSELGQKLDERNPAVREVVQRCEVVTLRPLDADLLGYLKHRFKLSGTTLKSVMNDSAVEALRSKLSRSNYSVLYPLAVHNVLTAALNEAASLGVPQLTADLIAGV